MGKKRLSASGVLLIFFVPIGLVILVIWILGRNGRNTSMPQVIRQALAGYPESTIRNWIAISAHETNNWTSRVFREANNLFGMTLPSKNTTAVGALDYGEHQAIFKSPEDSATDIRLYMEKRFKYPRQFPTLLDQIIYMKDRKYFGDSLDNYFNGVATRYEQQEKNNFA